MKVHFKRSKIRIEVQSTFHDWVSLEDLLLDPRMLTADCRQELQDELRALGFPRAGLAAVSNTKQALR